MAKQSGVKSIAVNKKARHLYELLESFEAGVALQGVEVKSLRQGHVSFKDGYVEFKSGEAWLRGVHIAPYENAGYVQIDPERERKLLLHTEEIERLTDKVEQKGLSVVPVRMYFKNGRVKLEISLARGKKLHDRREDIKQRDIAKDTARQLARY
ncbi:SsrA-binding protein SmpB [Desulfocurvibacter africanus]|uniref:SsrA-binding protein n=1 Tax=Desulfocurvibacter africanus subsp. africanus str. Walvis Bay TaxID=690850 RepID=F3Z140_DESAF|nr:SsrA-binding protein SmpB [Desulfocurvibacter africanus]EGJ49938.1 SsrA-binding protein [Desulfocurvibacter africanus subsp. africanus str. Walvis Bay]